MERLSSHVSTAKATFSGRSPHSAQDGNGCHRHAGRQHVRGLQKALRHRLQPELPAATLQLCSHGTAQCKRQRTSQARCISAAIAEPPLEVIEETFPRGASWEVISNSHCAPNRSLTLHAEDFAETRCGACPPTS